MSQPRHTSRSGESDRLDGRLFQIHSRWGSGHFPCNSDRYVYCLQAFLCRDLARLTGFTSYTPHPIATVFKFGRDGFLVTQPTFT